MTGGRAAIIGAAIGAVLAGVAVAISFTVMKGPAVPPAEHAGLESALAASEAELLTLRQTVAVRDAEIARLTTRLAAATRPGPETVLPKLETADDVGEGDLTETLVPMKGRFNRGIERPTNSFMLATLGAPRESYGTDCAPVTNPRLAGAMETGRIGSQRVRLLAPAMASLREVLAGLEQDEPEIFAAIGTAGGLCARLVRGAKSAISNHSWGTAVDLTLAGQLDRFGDGDAQFGLFLIAERFNAAGWYWGAGYGREDAMHFEAGAALVRSWVAADGALR